MERKNQKKTAQHEPKIVYYNDELNDDFAGTHIKAKTIDKNFKYIHKNPIWRFFTFFVYNVIAIPVVTIYCKLFKRVKFVNRKAVRKAQRKQKNGMFFYGNHTAVIDAYTPNIISIPRRNKILVSPDTVSIKGMKNIIQLLGGVPVPNDLSGMRNFTKAVEYYNKKGYNITIFPEAHIWPYYTGVRNFKDSSFAYPVLTNSPVFAFFTAYSKPKGLFAKHRKANITVYVSDAFYPDLTKTKKEAQKELRDKCYNFMKEYSEKYTEFVYIDYQPAAPTETNQTQINKS